MIVAVGHIVGGQAGESRRQKSKIVEADGENHTPGKNFRTIVEPQYKSSIVLIEKLNHFLFKSGDEAIFESQSIVDKTAQADRETFVIISNPLLLAEPRQRVPVARSTEIRSKTVGLSGACLAACGFLLHASIGLPKNAKVNPGAPPRTPRAKDRRDRSR